MQTLYIYSTLIFVLGCASNTIFFWQNNSVHKPIFNMVSELHSTENLIPNPENSLPPITNPHSTTEAPLIALNIAIQINEKLTPSTFPQWRAQFEALLIGYNLIDYVTGDKPCPLQITPLFLLFKNLIGSGKTS